MDVARSTRVKNAVATDRKAQTQAHISGLPSPVRRAATLSALVAAKVLVSDDSQKEALRAMEANDLAGGSPYSIKPAPAFLVAKPPRAPAAVKPKGKRSRPSATANAERAASAVGSAVGTAGSQASAEHANEPYSLQHDDDDSAAVVPAGATAAGGASGRHTHRVPSRRGANAAGAGAAGPPLGAGDVFQPPVYDDGDGAAGLEHEVVQRDRRQPPAESPSSPFGSPQHVDNAARPTHGPEHDEGAAEPHDAASGGDGNRPGRDPTRYVTHAQLRAALSPVHRRIDEMSLDVNRRFDDVNRRFDEMSLDVNRRFDDVNRRIGTIDGSLEQIFAVLSTISARLGMPPST